MKYSRASTLFFNAPLALLPSKIDELRAFWEAKLAGAALDFEDRQQPFAAIQQQAAGGGVIAVIPLHGVMAQRMNMMSAMSGGTSTQVFAQALREQVNNPQVKAVIIDVDSPGGSVYGVQELADAIWSMKGAKPIVAVVNSLAASAAYWAISQCDEIVATVGADLGHIGVASLLVDRSGEAEQAGVKVLQVTAGKYKHEQAIGSDLTPWTDEQVAHAQQRVDEAYGMFVNSVARGRGVRAAEVRDGFGQGRVVGAAEGVRLGLADRIATLDETIARFANGGRVTRRAGASAELPIEDEEEVLEQPADAEPPFEEVTEQQGPEEPIEPAPEETPDELAIETEQRERNYRYEPA